MQVFKRLVAGLLVLFSSSCFAGQWVGTGFFIASHGYIATAAHVVETAKVLKVTYDGVQYSASVVSIDHVNDSAIIKIAVNNPTSYTFNLDPKANESIYVVGFPDPWSFGWNLKEKEGIVVELLRRINTKAISCGGNSGGPLLNRSNQVIGITTRGSYDIPNTACGFYGQAEYIYHTVQLATQQGILVKINKLPTKHKWTGAEVKKFAVEQNSIVLISGEDGEE